MSDKISEIIKTKNQNEWDLIFKDSDACYAPVLSIDDAHKNPHLVERENFIKINDVLQPSPSPRFSETKSNTPIEAPSIGLNNSDILKDLGYNEDDIDLFKNKNIIN